MPTRFTRYLHVGSGSSTFTTEFADVGPEPLVYPHVGVQGGAPVECLSAGLALVWFL